MKKISSLIVCLALLAVGTAFALELPDALKIPGLTVTGDVRTGLQVSGRTLDDFGKNGVFKSSRDSGAEDPSVKAYSDDIGDGTPFRAQLQLVWERDNLGVKTRFRYRPDEASGDLADTLNNLNLTVNKAFAYAYLWDKKIKVSAGKGTDEAWGLFYSNFGGGPTTGFDGKDGIKVEVKPIDGLNVGAFYGTGNLFALASRSEAFTDQAEKDRRLVVGAKYESSLFKVVATTYHNFVESPYSYTRYDQKPIVEADPSATPPVLAVYPSVDYTKGINLPGYIDEALPNTSNLLVGVQVTPIEPLTIDLSVAAVNIGSKTAKELNGGDDTGGYKKGDYNEYFAVLPKFKVSYALNEQLSFGLGIHDLQFADAYYTAETDTTKPADERGLGYLFPITINPSVAYALSDNLTLGLDLNFKINVDGSDQFGFGLKPAATFSLGSGATFVVYDEITLYSKSNDDADFLLKHSRFPGIPNAAIVGPLNGASGTTNTLQFDFVWSF